MPTAATVIADYYTLSSAEQNTVKTTILSLPVAGVNLHTYVETQRFKNGRVCPHCGSVHVVRNGKRKDGTQRFLCRDCKKSFVASACSIAARTRKSLYVWDKFIECMLGGETLSEWPVNVASTRIPLLFGDTKSLMFCRRWLQMSS